MVVTDQYEKESARDYAFRIIKQNIITLTLKPGSMISENELSEQLGISRTPIREALIELSKGQLIEVRPQRGSYVTLIDMDLVEEARFFRMVLECAVVQLVCQHASEKDILDLEHNIKLQEFFLVENEPDQLIQLDNQLHESFFQISKRKLTYQYMNSMTAHFDRVRNLSIGTSRDKKNVEDHRNLVEAIRERDGNKANEIMTKHLTRVIFDEKELAQQYPDYFKQTG